MDQLEELLNHFGTLKSVVVHRHAEESLLNPVVDKKAARAEYSVPEGILNKNENMDMEKFKKNADAYPNLKVLYQAALVCPSTCLLRKRVLSIQSYQNKSQKFAESKSC